jgi:hypothetical protein
VRICEHPKDNYEKVHGQFNRCPECRSHVCLRCGLVDNIAWSSGVCDGCYRVRERESREQQARWTAEARRQERERIWAEGHAAGRQDEYCLTPNPYAATEES